MGGARILAVHIHDTDGRDDRHWLPGRGTINWQEFLDALDEIDFAGPRILELEAPTGQENELIRQARALVSRWEAFAG